MPYYAFNDVAGCVRQDAAVFDSGLVCDPSIKIRRLQIDGVEPKQLDFVDIELLNMNTGLSDSIGFRFMEIYGELLARMLLIQSRLAAACNLRFLIVEPSCKYNCDATLSVWD